jgi:SAM-dependent methyltransferase
MSDAKLHLVREVWSGKSLGRILLNREIARSCGKLEGVVFDLASGGDASYRRYWHLHASKFIRVDVDPRSKPDIVHDLSSGMPLFPSAPDIICLFNALYIFRYPERILAGIHTALAPRGRLILSTPLIFGESREPHDYWRFTSEGLEAMITSAGYSSFKIIPIGERVSSSVSNLHTILRFRLIRLVAYSLALLLDCLVPRHFQRRYPCPTGYLVIAHK